MKNIILIIALFLIRLVGISQIEVVKENALLNNVETINVDITPNIEETPVITPNADFSTQEKITTNEYRRIYFLHGLGGEGNSWVKAADACEQVNLNVNGFNARKCVTWPRIDYNLSVNGSLITAANSIRYIIQDQANIDQSSPFMDHDKTRAFIIGHSQGGVIGRTILYQDFKNDVLPNDPLHPENPLFYEKGYGGLVTVGSSMQGAMILNNQNLILQMAHKACLNLTAGPLNKEINDITSLPFINSILHNWGKSVQTTACDLFSYDLLPLFFKDNQTPITQYYHVGSSFINDLNGTTTVSEYNNFPKVAFYGVEPRQNLLWRTITWFTTSPNDFDAWEANNDVDLLTSTIIPKYNDYVAQYEGRKNKLANLEAHKWVNWVTLGSTLISYIYCNVELHISVDAWKQGIDWFNQANLQWEVVIGAARTINTTSTTTGPYYRCDCREEYDPLNNIVVDDPVICLDEGCAATYIGYITNYNYTMTEKASDGVVLAESASNLPSAQWIVELDGKQLPFGVKTGSSHMQMRNDDALKRNLTKLFEGEYGEYFYTDKK